MPLPQGQVACLSLENHGIQSRLEHHGQSTKNRLDKGTRRSGLASAVDLNNGDSALNGGPERDMRQFRKRDHRKHQSREHRDDQACRDQTGHRADILGCQRSTESSSNSLAFLAAE